MSEQVIFEGKYGRLYRDGTYVIEDIARFAGELMGAFADQRAAREAAERRFAGACTELHEVQQVCGKALRYPRYCDDPKNFPHATPEDGVCTGGHTSVTIVTELAEAYAAERAAREAAENEVARLAREAYQAKSLAAGMKAAIDMMPKPQTRTTSAAALPSRLLFAAHEAANTTMLDAELALLAKEWPKEEFDNLRSRAEAAERERDEARELLAAALAAKDAP